MVIKNTSTSTEKKGKRNKKVFPGKKRENISEQLYDFFLRCVSLI